jgi:flagellar biosynthesis protein FlhF
MKIKKFLAPSFREALTQIKKELGEDAIILSSEEVNGLRPKVEVVAAIEQAPDEGESTANPLVQREMTRESLAEFTADKASVSTVPTAPKVQNQTPYYNQVVQELGNLRAAIEELKGKGYEVTLPEEKKRIFQFLRARSIREDLALNLTEKATDFKAIAELMSKDIQMGWDWSERKIIMLIGSTGVGKTTTAAKLCGQAIKQNKKVGFISLDTFRIGAIEQIRIYSRILGVPLIVASSPEEVSEGINKLKDRDLILIDTTGRNPKDGLHAKELKRVYDTGIPMETHLLLSGSSSERFMSDSFRHYQNLPISKIAFTKMDEAGDFGSIYNFSVQAQKPIAYLTTGQKVPHDIEFFNGPELVDLILNRTSSEDFCTSN